MAFSKATPPKVPKSIGVITLTLWAGIKETVVGTVEVQVLDEDGNEYQKESVNFPLTVDDEFSQLAEKLLSSVRLEAEKEILG